MRRGYIGENWVFGLQILWGCFFDGDYPSGFWVSSFGPFLLRLVSKSTVRSLFPVFNVLDPFLCFLGSIGLSEVVFGYFS